VTSFFFVVAFAGVAVALASLRHFAYSADFKSRAAAAGFLLAFGVVGAFAAADDGAGLHPLAALAAAGLAGVVVGFPLGLPGGTGSINGVSSMVGAYHSIAYALGVKLGRRGSIPARYSFYHLVVAAQLRCKPTETTSPVEGFDGTVAVAIPADGAGQVAARFDGKPLTLAAQSDAGALRVGAPVAVVGSVAGDRVVVRPLD
jgi:hypothetical protein